VSKHLYNLNKYEIRGLSNKRGFTFTALAAILGAVAAVGGGVTAGVQGSQAGAQQKKANAAAQEQGAKSLLEQQNFNDEQLSLQKEQQGQLSSSVLSGSGMESSFGGNSENVIPGASQLLGKPQNQNNVVTWS